MPHIYTLVNQKGGVGKTTTAINLGAYLAYFGQRVLLIDLDPQANATSCLGVDRKTVKTGTYEALLGQGQTANSILHNPRLRLSLLPSSQALAGAEIELVNEMARETRLRTALAPIASRYDYILIDCPPSLGLLTVNGLVAAQDGIIIPVQCEYLALEGIGHLNHTIQRVRSHLFPELRIRGLVMTMYDARTRLALDVVDEVRRYFPNQVFNALIPRSIRLAEAPSHGQPISMYAPTTTGAEAYKALARELLEGDGVKIPAIEPV
ncbi:MAG: AAA family ATPase [Anaerolineales bacterium]